MLKELRQWPDHPIIFTIFGGEHIDVRIAPESGKSHCSLPLTDLVFTGSGVAVMLWYIRNIQSVAANRWTLALESIIMLTRFVFWIGARTDPQPAQFDFRRDCK